jgi:hypothetical protein
LEKLSGHPGQLSCCVTLGIKPRKETQWMIFSSPPGYFDIANFETKIGKREKKEENKKGRKGREHKKEKRKRTIKGEKGRKKKRRRVITA